jgi:hypothetical protein
MPTDQLTKDIEQAAEQVAAEVKEQADAEQEATGQEDNRQAGAEETVAENSETHDTASEDAEEQVGLADAAKRALDSHAAEDESSSSSVAEQKDDEPSVPDLSDDIIGRAIKAGMTLTDALAFPNEASLDRVVAAAERTQQSESQDGAEKDPFTDLNLDPEEYEPEMVELMGRVKGVLENQHKQIEDQHKQIDKDKRKQRRPLKRRMHKRLYGGLTSK